MSSKDAVRLHMFESGTLKCHVPPACWSARGQTEAAVDLARLAGLNPAGVICGS